MGKKVPQAPSDETLQYKVRQYLITARRKPTEKDKEPKIIQMRIFAQNKVQAATKFWYQMRLQCKLRASDGEIISINELFEKNPATVKLYGIVVRFPSRTAQHNSYKEIRDTTLNGAVSQLLSQLAGQHRVKANNIHIVRTVIVTGKIDNVIKRSATYQLYGPNVKFPIMKYLPRSSQRKYRTTFKANRPNLRKG